ncbi:MAG: Lipid A biosynthesis lauroyltransferase [Chlamydiales bacterium]|nr:Lipid A biosynthesis lauroyltransferase [Chlamydiales bacterium]
MISYFFIRFFGFFIALLPHRALFAFGQFTGWLAFYLHRSFRKKALTNLAIAYGKTKSEKERKKLAIASFQNLLVTLLEFFYLKKSRLDQLITLEERSEIADLLKKKQGVIFLSAHQANWEIPFLAVTARFPGIAIGRPIKNQRLYRWVLSVREMCGGKIVMTKSAIHQGMRALKRGEFLGIVGDQAFPSSPYSYPLFGTRAWTASSPALLAHKTGCPIVVGTTKRVGRRYEIKGSAPIWPNSKVSIKEDVPRMMDLAMERLETSIQECPEQWMWVHDRWKQQGVNHVKRIYRYGFILVVLPPKPNLEIIPVLRKIYPKSFLTFFTKKGCSIPGEEVHPYEKEEDLFVRDWRYQLVLDFYDLPHLRKHYRKLGAFKAIHLPQEQEKIIQTLVKPECPITVST